jgi:hypothetical protein
MPKLIALTATGLTATALLVSTSLAQDPPPETVVTVEAKVTPNKAGTKAKPQAVQLSGKLHWEHPPGYERPVITGAKLWFPKGSLYNGGKYPKCSLATLARRPTPSACPNKSIMGKGTGVAYADTVITRPKVTIINGGAKSICLFTVLMNPARVQTCVPGTIKKMRGKWAYQLTLTVPRVLQVVAGVPIALRDFSWTVGSPKKDWLATTGCPKNKRWPYKVETFYSTGGSDVYEDSVPCR